MINIAIVDDKEYSRVLLSENFSFANDIKVLFSATNGEDFLKQMKKQKKLPDVVLMDIDMPVLNGIETVNVAAKLYPKTKFVMLTVFDNDDKIFAAIKAGAIGYLLKDESVDRIVDAIKQIAEFGDSPMSPSIAQKVLQMLIASDFEQKRKAETVLSNREMEILKGLVEGLDYKDVAENLCISPNTVRTHINKIYQKLQVNSKTQAVMVAVKNKWF